MLVLPTLPAGGIRNPLFLRSIAEPNRVGSSPMALTQVDSLVIQLIDAIRAQVLGELKGMSLADLLKVAGGSDGAPAPKRGPGRPKRAASASASASTSAPKKAAGRGGKRLRRSLDDIQ